MQDSTRRTIRTTVQTAVTLAGLLPVIVDEAHIPATLPWVAGALFVAGALTRVMALPGVNRLLPSWMRLSADPDAEAFRQAVRE